MGRGHGNGNSNGIIGKWVVDRFVTATATEIIHMNG